MSDFLGSPPARSRPVPDQARTLEMLATLFVVALLVTMLYVGREIFGGSEPLILMGGQT